jgi:hypothetical protein
MIAPKDQPGDDDLFDAVQFGHQLRKQRLAGLIKERPPGFLAALWMDDTLLRRSFGR